MNKQKKVKESKEKIKKKVQELKGSKLFLVAFIRELKKDKKFLLSFIITLIFIATMTTLKVKEAESAYTNKKKSSQITQEVVNDETTTITTKEEANESSDNDQPDVSDYVGIYSKEVKLDNVIQINDTCSIDSYKIIYQVKKDRSIKKYFSNSCIGIVKIFSDTLTYNSYGGAKYISANDINYTFNDNTLKEVDGDKYELDDDISNIKEKKALEEAELYFYGSNIVFLTNTNLILISNNKVTSPITDDYKNNGGNLEKRFYKSENIKYQFNFIVFKNEEAISCYDKEENDDPLYTIYSIRYDINSNNFMSIKEVLARSKSNSCTTYEEDLETLKE